MAHGPRVRDRAILTAMSPTLDELTALLTLEPIEPGLFRGRQPRHRLQRVFGGQVAAQALVAAGAHRRGQVGALAARLLPAPGRPRGPDPVLTWSGSATGARSATRRVVARQHGEVDLLHDRVVPGARGRLRAPGRDARRRSQRPRTRRRWPARSAADPARRARSWAQEWAALDVRLSPARGPAAASRRRHAPGAARGSGSGRPARSRRPVAARLRAHLRQRPDPARRRAGAARA